MLPIHQTLFTAGQFARLCSTTKETLRHYHSAGILMPVYTKDNGYQYYTAGQFFDFQLIRSLKMAGSSLAEIHTYLSSRGNEAYLQILRQKQNQLREEQKKLARMEQLLSQTIKKMETAMAGGGRLCCPELTWCEEEYLIAMPVPEGYQGTEEETVSLLSRLVGHCTERGLMDEFQLGAIISLDSCLSGQMTESKYYSRLSAPADSPWLQIKPAGFYVRILFDGNDEESAINSHQLIFRFLEEHHLRPCGCLYEEELTVYQNAATATPYTIQLLMQAEGAETLP